MARLNLASARIVVALELIDLRGPNQAGSEIHRTREAINVLPPKPSTNGEFSCNPIPPAGVVIDRDPEEVDVLRAEAGNRAVSDIILADLDGLRLREVLVVAKASSVAVKPSSFIKSSAIERLLTGPVEAIPPISVLADRAGAISPEQVKCVTFGSALAVLYLNDRGSIAVARVARQGLLAPPIHAGKPEVRGIRRHGSGAFKPPPLWSLTPGVPKGSGIPSNLDLGRFVHHHLNGAFTPIWIAAIYKNRFALKCLSCYGSRRHDYSDQESPFPHRIYLASTGLCN